jgi:hypothetical protein
MPKPAGKKGSTKRAAKRGVKKAKRQAPSQILVPDAKSFLPKEEEIWQELFMTREMEEYLDTSDKITAAQERGDKEVSVPTDLAVSAIANSINFRDPKLMEAWNRCCDLVGLPEKKRSVEFPKEGPTGKDMVTLRDITVYKAIRFKKRTKDDKGGSGAGGPF